MDGEGEVKVVVVGNGCVGKTSMIQQFCKGMFRTEYKKTIGVDFLEKVQFIRVLDEDVKLMLWDTAGQEQFHAMTRAYYRAQVQKQLLCVSPLLTGLHLKLSEAGRRRNIGPIVLGVPLNTYQTHMALPNKEFRSHSCQKCLIKVEEECGVIPMVLVQNKVDLLEYAAVSRQEAEELATELGLRFYRICVKENMYVADVFEYLAELYVRRDKSYHHLPSRPPIGKALALSPEVALAQLPQVVDPDVKKQCKRTKIFNITRKTRRDVLRLECSIL